MLIHQLFQRDAVHAYVGHTPGEAIFGVELEIEDVGAEPEDFCPSHTIIKEDGSLRNNGMEFVTYPLHYREAMQQVEKVLSHFQSNTESHFSERTSCHVHVNVGDMTCHQLAAMLLAYQVVERLLFAFVGGDRDKNIFCVPLAECATSYQAARRLNELDIMKVLDTWRKYTAFNFCRLSDICTVEFRHMPGTPDANKIGQWMRMIKSLRDFAMRTVYTELAERINTLNTSSMYQAFAFDVLGDLPWWRNGEHSPMLEEGVLTAKYSLLNQDVKKKSVLKAPPQVVRVDNQGALNMQQGFVWQEWRAAQAGLERVVIDDMYQREVLEGNN